MNKTFQFEQGPIEEFSWARFVINGKEHAKQSNGKIVGAGKDIRIVQGKVTPWKERNGHMLKKNMITGIFDHDVDLLIIGNGVYGSLSCPQEVKNYILNHGISKLIIKKTPAACKHFNRSFLAGENIALLAHGSC
ncbi:MAG: hypothetical protein KGY75_10200 [Candidatus Cloacimonetes bacterium]|nr:hypothetical protein [Candidatus Cloacimonadota bacterium]MBS3768473.1 hypothetical protein [Candidatus Cloacimonadota bacterium]